MKLFRVGLILFFLVGGFCVYNVKAGIFAKHIPTYDALKDELIAEANGFKGAATQEIDKRGITEENGMPWNKCVGASQAAQKVTQLGNEITVILEYYKITEGSEESASNFHKWLKALDYAWKAELKEVCSCYDKATRI